MSLRHWQRDGELRAEAGQIERHIKIAAGWHIPKSIDHGSRFRLRPSFDHLAKRCIRGNDERPIVRAVQARLHWGGASQDTSSRQGPPVAPLARRSGGEQSTGANRILELERDATCWDWRIVRLAKRNDFIDLGRIEADEIGPAAEASFNRKQLSNRRREHLRRPNDKNHSRIGRMYRVSIFPAADGSAETA